jgi:anti-sigma B factor antagonist
VSNGDGFLIIETEHGDELLIVVRGELDLVAAPQLTGVLRGHVGAGRRAVIDLSDVTFMDSSGLGAIVMSAQGEAARSLLTIRRSRHDQPNRLLDLTGVSGILTQIEP